MNDTILINYKKSIFWQRVIAGAVAFSLFIGMLFFLYFFIASYEYRQLFGRSNKRTIFTASVVIITCLIGLGLTIYLNWSLFKAANCLKKYTASDDMNDLGDAIKYQTVFWRLFTLSPFIAFGLFVLMFILIVLTSNVIEGGTIFTPEPVRVG